MELSIVEKAFLEKITDKPERLTFIISWIEVLEEDGRELARSSLLIRDEIIRRGIKSDPILKAKLSTQNIVDYDELIRLYKNDDPGALTIMNKPNFVADMLVKKHYLIVYFLSYFDPSSTSKATALTKLLSLGVNLYDLEPNGSKQGFMHYNNSYDTFEVIDEIYKHYTGRVPEQGKSITFDFNGTIDEDLMEKIASKDVVLQSEEVKIEL